MKEWVVSSNSSYKENVGAREVSLLHAALNHERMQRSKTQISPSRKWVERRLRQSFVCIILYLWRIHWQWKKERKQSFHELNPKDKVLLEEDVILMDHEKQIQNKLYWVNTLFVFLFLLNSHRQKKKNKSFWITIPLPLLHESLIPFLYFLEVKVLFRDTQRMNKEEIEFSAKTAISISS